MLLRISFIVLLLSFGRGYALQSDTIRICDSIPKKELSITFHDDNNVFWKAFDSLFQSLPNGKFIYYAESKPFFILDKIDNVSYNLLRFNRTGNAISYLSKLNGKRNGYQLAFDGSKTPLISAVTYDGDDGDVRIYGRPNGTPEKMSYYKNGKMKNDRLKCYPEEVLTLYKKIFCKSYQISNSK